MIVVDASATYLALDTSANDRRASEARRELARDAEWAAPEHWRIEMLSIVRGLALGGKLDEVVARRLMRRLDEIEVLAIATGPLTSRIWELRSNLSAYDAAYVAAAEIHGIPLVTADARIARAGVARCEVRVTGGA